MIYSSRNDKLEQWALHRAVKDEVKESILGRNKQKVWNNQRQPKTRLKHVDGWMLEHKTRKI